MIDFGIPGRRLEHEPHRRACRRRWACASSSRARFTQPGVIVPVMPEFYEPALEELQRLGISFTETTEIL